MNINFLPPVEYPKPVIVTENVELRVRVLYKEIINREPTNNELSVWTTAIKNRTNTYSDLSNFLFQSDEYIQAEAQRGEPFVERIPVDIKAIAKPLIPIAVVGGIIWILTGL